MQKRTGRRKTMKYKNMNNRPVYDKDKKRTDKVQLRKQRPKTRDGKPLPPVCKRGHYQVGDAVYEAPNGKKNCRDCKALRDNGKARTRSAEKRGQVAEPLPRADRHPVLRDETRVGDAPRPIWRPASLPPEVPVDVEEWERKWSA